MLSMLLFLKNSEKYSGIGRKGLDAFQNKA